MAEDPWLVEELEDHVRFSSIPETRDRALAGLGGPAVTLEDAFPDWPGRLERAAGGDVRGTLEFVSSLFADAGLGRIVVVDQTSREHADAGIAVARAVVPGIVPMCFGHAQQRLDGLPGSVPHCAARTRSTVRSPTTPTRSRDGPRPGVGPAGTGRPAGSRGRQQHRP